MVITSKLEQKHVTMEEEMEMGAQLYVKLNQVGIVLMEVLHPLLFAYV